MNALAVEDVRQAADILRSAYEESDGTDGFVSIEPPPQLTRDTSATIGEAQRLWRIVDRPNLMIKVVATPEGVAAVEALSSQAINVNITLIFSLRHYEAVSAAYIRGVERCGRPERVASVASFFVSRVDTEVDRSLEAHSRSTTAATNEVESTGVAQYGLSTSYSTYRVFKTQGDCLRPKPVQLAPALLPRSY
jgi:transaldolase